jgi:hypothetical protein
MAWIRDQKTGIIKILSRIPDLDPGSKSTRSRIHNTPSKLGAVRDTSGMIVSDSHHNKIRSEENSKRETTNAAE